MSFLSLLVLELLFNGRLVLLLVLKLTRVECCGRTFEFGADLVGKGLVILRLTFCLDLHCIKGNPQVPAKSVSIGVSERESSAGRIATTK